MTGQSPTPDDVQGIYRKPPPPARRLSPFGLSVLISLQQQAQNSSQNEQLNEGLDDPIDFLGPGSGLGPDTPTAATFDRITKLPTPIIKQGLFSSTFSGHSNILSSSPGAVTSTSPSTLSPVYEESNMNPLSRETKNFRAISEYKPTGLVRKSLLLEGSLAAQPLVFTNQRVVSTPMASTGTEATPPPKDGTENDDKSLQNQPPKSRSGDVYVAPHNGARYIYQKDIGSGTFSTVVLAINAENSHDCAAVKIVHVPLTSERETFNFKAVIRRELNALNSIHHPCIVGLLDYSVSVPLQLGSGDDGDLDPDLDLAGAPVSASAITLVYNAVRENNEQLLFLTYSRGGNLYQMQHQHRTSQARSVEYWTVIRRIVAELICAVAHLHSHDIVHRDIKLENILVNFPYQELMSETCTNDSFTNLTDFGLSRRLRYSGEFLTTRCGSQDYVSPELLLGIPYDGKLTDSWAVGVVIYALLENRLPFDVPPNIAPQNGISPLVLKRRRNKNTAAHRIAMLSWDWYTVLEMVSDDHIPGAAKNIIAELKEIVEQLLVRKDRRVVVSDLLGCPIMDCVPPSWR
ncbi:hypothetical protein QFC19_007161 [Naganishia cerealis]|uniref:Uncharacterized protein n=1 Tax=Naganishia cerealis TaxID=610337 RepID=A0ACC2VC33_9TREE|nr:hypothetical protein QFC19_007161 [Naganishia cerealis]